jgi:hypothetical protein
MPVKEEEEGLKKIFHLLAASNLLQIACLGSSDLKTKGNFTITFITWL